MSGGYNANPGSIQTSAGEVIWMRTYVFASSTTAIRNYGPQGAGGSGYSSPSVIISNPPVPAVVQSSMLATLNLPNLQWYVWLDTMYVTDTGAGDLTFFPQNNITFVPIASEQAVWAGPTIPPPDPSGIRGFSAYPMAAPMVLPIGLPVRINITAPVNSIGVWFQLPITPNVSPAIAPVGTFNRVHVMLSASA